MTPLEIRVTAVMTIVTPLLVWLALWLTNSI